jgi:hypothetical protein
MTWRLLLDENFDHDVLREYPELLEWAAKEDRVILTRDVKTFIGFEKANRCRA